MKKMVSLALALMIAAGCFVLTGGARADQEVMFVKTGNGKTLNVRSVNDNKVIGRLNYGDRVTVNYESGGWAFIAWEETGEAKVMMKYLTGKDPGKFEGPTTEDGTVLQDSALGSETVEGMNKQYSLMQYVTGYTVLTVPANRTGTVNLRWGPSKNANLVMKLPAEYELKVLAESRNWLLVSDPASGRVGYIARKYTNAQ